MVWDESKHPRDDIGRFTFSSGGDSSNDSQGDTTVLRGRVEKTQDKRTPSDILYGGTSKKEKSEKEYRNVLLNILKNTITPAMVLYATTKELEQAVKKNGLEGKLTGAASPINNNNKRNINGLNLYDKLETKDSAIKSVSGRIINEHYFKEQNIVNETASKNNFDYSIEKVFNAEGGYSDNKLDRGGRTNLGITQNTYNAYNKKHNIEQKDVKNITKDEAKKIYYDEYWLKSGANNIKDKRLAYMHFDSAVNHGVKNAEKFYKESNGNFEKYYQIRKKFYDKIVQNHPNQKIYYKGWINRIDKIKNSN